MKESYLEVCWFLSALHKQVIYIPATINGIAKMLQNIKENGAVYRALPNQLL